MCKQLIFSQGRAGRNGFEPGDEPVEGGGFLLDFDAEAGGQERQIRGERGDEGSQPDLILGSRKQGGGARGASGGLEAFKIASVVGVMVAESDPAGEAQAGGFKAGKELLGAGDAAKGQNRTVDWRDRPCADAGARSGLANPSCGGRIRGKSRRRGWR